MVRWVVWVLVPIVCYVLQPQVHAVGAPLTLVDVVIGFWTLWTGYAVLRGAYRWFFRTAAKAWYSQAPRNQ